MAHISQGPLTGDLERWSVVNDPPNRLRTSMLFVSKEDAESYMKRMFKAGKAQNLHLVPPGPPIEGELDDDAG